jgi:azurin
MRMLLTLACSALFALVACDDNSPKPTAQAAPAATPAPTPTPAPAPSATPAAAQPAAAVPGMAVELEIASVGDTMTFDKTALTVPAGSQVHLKLKNNGKIPVMQHNWVLVNTGKEASVASEGLTKAATTGYVVEGPDVLAHTPLAQPGQTVEVTFKAPAAGKYPYICTYPGHYIMMKGVLTVTP